MLRGGVGGRVDRGDDLVVLRLRPGVEEADGVAPGALAPELDHLQRGDAVAAEWHQHEVLELRVVVLGAVLLEPAEDRVVDGVDGVVVGLARCAVASARAHLGVDERQVALGMGVGGEQDVLGRAGVAVAHRVVGEPPRLGHGAAGGVILEVLEVVVGEVGDDVLHPAWVPEVAVADRALQALGDAQVGQREHRAVVAGRVQRSPLPAQAALQPRHAADARLAAVLDPVGLHVCRRRRVRQQRLQVRRRDRRREHDD